MWMICFPIVKINTEWGCEAPVGLANESNVCPKGLLCRCLQKFDVCLSVRPDLSSDLFLTEIPLIAPFWLLKKGPKSTNLSRSILLRSHEHALRSRSIIRMDWRFARRTRISRFRCVRTSHCRCEYLSLRAALPCRSNLVTYFDIRDFGGF